MKIFPWSRMISYFGFLIIFLRSMFKWLAFQAWLRDHGNTHLPYNCFPCNNAFDTKAKFRNHLNRNKSCKTYMKNHSKSQPQEDSTLMKNSQFLCLTCNKSFGRKNNYERHVKFRCGSGKLKKITNLYENKLTIFLFLNFKI